MDSKRQYIHQLGKWGFFKNKKQSDNVDDIPNDVNTTNLIADPKDAADSYLDRDELQNNIDKFQSEKIHPRLEPSCVLISESKTIENDGVSTSTTFEAAAKKILPPNDST